MDWLLENWVWALIGVAFIAMHMFGHGGHAGHGRHGESGDGRKTSREPAKERDEDSTPGHRH